MSAWDGLPEAQAQAMQFALIDALVASLEAQLDEEDGEEVMAVTWDGPEVSATWKSRD